MTPIDAGQKIAGLCRRRPAGIDQQRHVVAVLLPVLEPGRIDADVARAMAVRWIGALVEPPIAELTTMALRKASRVRMSEGFRSS